MAAQEKKDRKEDLKSFKEEIVHEFRIFSENVMSQVKQVAEGVVNVNEKIDRVHEELKADAEDKFQTLGQAIKSIDEKLESTRQEFGVKIDETRQEFGVKIDETRQELKTEIRETRQEVLAAIKFSYAELDRRLTILEKQFLELKLRVDKMEGHTVS